MSDEALHPQTRTALGVFDVLKGLTMLLIVYYHTAELYTLTPNTVFWYLKEGINNTVVMGTNTAFFIIAGYSLRKRPVKKMISGQWDSLKRPYILTAIVRAGMLIAVHFIFFRSPRNAIIEGLRAALGSLLGLYSSVTVGGFLIFPAGPMWFLVSMSVGLILLNAVLNLVPEKWVTAAIAGILAAFVVFCAVFGSPRSSLLLGLSACVYCYVGYYLKKARLFSGRKRFLKQGLALAAILTLVHIIFFPDGLPLSYENIPESLFYALMELAWGIALCLLFVNIDPSESIIARFLAFVGRYSLYIFCAHTVELMVFPWYIMVEKYASRPTLGFVLNLIAHCGIVAVFSLIIYFCAHIPGNFKAKHNG